MRPLGRGPSEFDATGIGGRRGPFHRRGGTSWNPRVDQENDTHREHKNERADKKASIQMKIANDGIESFHGLDQSLYTAAGSAWRVIALRCIS